MTKSLFFSISAVLLAVGITHVQHLKLNNGVSFTSFNTNDIAQIPTGSHTSYTGAIGIDYLEKKCYYLSSEIGYLSMGGSPAEPMIVNGYTYKTARKQMLHVNTTFRVFLNLSDCKLFMGIGPYLNAGLKNQFFQSPPWYPYVYKQNNGGAQLEMGVTRQLRRMRVGVLGTYMHGLSPAATGENVSISNNGMTAQLTVGYRLGKSPYNSSRSNPRRVR